MRGYRCALGVLFALLASSTGCAPDDAGVASGSGGASNGAAGGSSASGGTASGGSGLTGSGGTSSVSTGGNSATGGVAAGGGAAPGGSGGTAGAPSNGGAGGRGGRGGAPAIGGTAGAVVGSGGAAGAPGPGAGAVPLDPALMSRCTGSNPIVCTIPVPANGNYTVTVELGSATAASVSRVQGELFRIVVPPVSLAAGAFSQQTFNLNVRPEVHGTYTAPERILNILIDGSAPALHGVGFAAAPAIPTIFIAGDSTVCDWDPTASNITEPLQRGWAQELSQYLKPGISVANYADSGETAGSFYSGFWTPAKNLLRAGDYVFIQFGHNDQKVDLALYKPGLMRYIADARAKMATPVLFTPPGRRGATTASPGFAGLDQQARDLAAAQNVALVDLTTLAINYYRTVPNIATVFAVGDSTHFSEVGATALSNLVAQALKAGTLPLRDFVK